MSGFGRLPYVCTYVWVYVEVVVLVGWRYGTAQIRMGGMVKQNNCIWGGGLDKSVFNRI